MLLSHWLRPRQRRRQLRHSCAAATMAALSASSLLLVLFLLCILAVSSSSSPSRRHAVWAFQSQPPLGSVAPNRQLTSSPARCRLRAANAAATSNARMLLLPGGGSVVADTATKPTTWPSSTTARKMAAASSSSIDQQNATMSSSSASSAPSQQHDDISFADEEQWHRTASSHTQTPSMIPPILQNLIDKVGKIDESRIISSPEYLNGDVPKLFSNLQYETTITTITSTTTAKVQQLLEQQHPSNQSNQMVNTATTTSANDPDGTSTTTKTIVITKAKPAETNLLSSSALLCGTALGCGLLYLPTAIHSSAGYLPTVAATFVAWAYMTITALLTSELLINRYGETGRVRNVGLLELYDSYLGGGGGSKNEVVLAGLGGKVASLGFLIVSYVVMGVYLSEGGDQLMNIIGLATNIAAATASSSTGMIDGGTIMESNAPQDVVAMLAAPFSLANDEISNNAWLARAIFASAVGVFLSTAAKFNVVQRAMANVFVPTTLLAFLAAICIGLPTADFGSLTALKNQHPEAVLDAFPLLFMSWTYHGVVPRVVYDLEGDKNKITLAIVSGSTTALIIYLIWNAMILGNVFDSSSADVVGSAAFSVDSIATTIKESSSIVSGDLMMDGQGGSVSLSVITAASNSASPLLDTTHFKPLLLSSIAIVSELAVITSLIGVVLGFVNELNDAVGGIPPAPSNSPIQPNENDETKWKVALITLLPPAIVSVALGYFSDGTNVNNYQILDYTGIFGSSILFLILPALMAWQNRYGEDDPPRPLTVRPMVPLGKIPLGSLCKAAGTLIVEQGLDKLGVFEFVKEHIIWKTN